jgi:hypothetical protein
VSNGDETNDAAEAPRVRGGFAERLFIRDARGRPTAINREAYRAALYDPDFLTQETVVSLGEVDRVLDQVAPHEARLLLLCASDVATAADRFMEAELLRDRALSESLQLDPSVDPEVRGFLDGLRSWPSWDSQPPEVTRAIDRDLEAELCEREAMVLCRGRSVADFLDGELQWVLDRELWPLWCFLPAEAYGYFMPVTLEKVLRRHGWMCDDVASILGHFGPWLNQFASGRHGGRVDEGPLIHPGRLEGYTPLQKETFLTFLQLVRRRPDIHAFSGAQLEAAVCHHFLWKDRANWAEPR